MKTRLLILSTLSALLLVGCGTAAQSSAQKQADEKQTAEQVSKLLDEKTYEITVNYMNPLRGGGRAVSGPYSIRVDGTTIDSNLPYIGRAYNIPYGGGKVLTFKDEIDEYSDSGWKKGLRKIIFSTNNDEDTIVYTVTVSDDGYADINVHCRNREDITYRGMLTTRAKSDE